MDFTNRLPKVLNLYIFSYLEKKDLLHCCQTNKKFKEIASQDQLWKEYIEKIPEPWRPQNNFKEFLTQKKFAGREYRVIVEEIRKFIGCMPSRKVGLFNCSFPTCSPYKIEGSFMYKMNDAEGMTESMQHVFASQLPKVSQEKSALTQHLFSHIENRTEAGGKEISSFLVEITLPSFASKKGLEMSREIKNIFIKRTKELKKKDNGGKLLCTAVVVVLLWHAIGSII